MAIILPHGVLFRGGADELIRTKLIQIEKAITAAKEKHNMYLRELGLGILP